MIDLSDEPIEDNIKTCKEYLKRRRYRYDFEIELGITGGEEDELIIQMSVSDFILNLKSCIRI